MKPLHLLKIFTTVARTYGPRGLFFRSIHELRCLAGLFRHRPRYSELKPVSPPVAFKVNAHRLLSATDCHIAIRRANRVCAGEYEAFRSEWRQFENAAGFDPTKTSDVPWWKVASLPPGGQDIKNAWEASRFGWSYDLARAYVLTRDDIYAATFHDLLALWESANPAYRGVQWACGQETAIRAVALLYVEANIDDARSSTPESMDRVARVLAASGERIYDGLGYAISQRNNHGISEATGLIALGARFRGSHCEAHKWLDAGLKWLNRLVEEQFAADGWYAQHSFTYLRLALDQCVIAQRVLRSLHSSLGRSATERIVASLDLLESVIDPTTGIVPNHGANDGAFVHPITLGSYRDFRPVLTAAASSFDRHVSRSIQCDDEVLAWLDRPSPPKGAPIIDGIVSGPSGWVAARCGDTFAFLRAGRYEFRPGHADPLHVDIRFGSREIIVDPGTFSYNGVPPWRNGLAVASVHNSPIIDGREPGLRGPRFLWLLWPDADVVEVSGDSNGYQIVAEQGGRVRRMVVVNRLGVHIQDTALVNGEITVRWLLHPDASPSHVEIEGRGVTLHHASIGNTRGWFSPAYGVRIPSLTLEVRRTLRAGESCVTSVLHSRMLTPSPDDASSDYDP